jgi:hypothetical protein
MISFGKRLEYALRAFFSILDDGRIPNDVTSALLKPDVPPPSAAPTPERPDRAIQILALLQQDGRFIDFVMDDLSRYTDAELAAAVRDVHAGCSRALQRHFTLRSIVDAVEGDSVTVDPGEHPSRIRVAGNTSGDPPLRGIVRHRGWEAVKIELPPLTPGAPTVIAPAEIEVA